ncbi:MAG TPA: hypothetical protein VGM90_09480 [Kofleriaceae bacterium]|jgi:hypothetical protein
MITRVSLCLALLAACSSDSSVSPDDASLTATVTAGTPQRGGLVAVHLAPVEEGRTWSDVELFATPGLTVDARNVTATEIDALVAIDASAPLGDATIEIHSGTDVFSAPAAVRVADAADAPALRDTLHVQPDAAGASFAWIAPASSLALVDLEMNVPGAGTIVLDAEGTYPRPLAFTTTRSAVLDGVRGVAFYASDAFDVTAHRYPLRAIANGTDNTTFANATLLGTPDANVADAFLTGPDDARYFAVDIADASIGQRLRVLTLGDARTDTKIAVFRDDHVSLLGPVSDDTTMLDELVTPTVSVAGRYYIRVTAGAGFDATHSTFSLTAVTR